MAVKNKEELQKQLNEILGDNTSDEALALIEDFADTFDDLVTKNSEDTDWKTKYEENDRAWRNKYKERFMSPIEKDEPVEDEPEDDRPEVNTFEDLFKNE